jgi:hypothetical protein
MAGLPNIVIRPVSAGPGLSDGVPGNALPTKNPKQLKGEATTGVGTYGLTEYSDNYTSNYTTTNTFGRMDPIVSYSNTGREVTFGMLFEGGIGEGAAPGGNADIGMEFAKKIAQFQYPVYEGLNGSVPNALLIERPPLLFVHAGNLLSSQSTKNNGYALCLLKSFAYTPTIGFTPLTAPYVQADFRGNKVINFQSITVRFSLTVLHTQGPGYVRTGNDFTFLEG